MSQRLPVPPEDPISLEEVWAQYPAVRQSVLAKYDDCPLSCLFDLRHGGGWSTHPQAGGTIFHRFAAEFLRTLKRTRNADGTYEPTMPVSEAFEILYEVLRQKDIPLHERVRVPLRDLPKLHIAVKKFAADNRFSVDRIVDIERRLYVLVDYPLPGGGTVPRMLTGQLDVLLFEPPAGATVIDWKHTWQPPPERRGTGEDDRNAERRLSYEGYFQQRNYGLLVMKGHWDPEQAARRIPAYPNVNATTLREFYPLRGKVRRATISRAALEHVEREMVGLIEAFDESVAAGTHRTAEVDGESRRVEVAGRQVEGDAWPALPGKHCGFCAKPGACPIDDEARGEGAIKDDGMAERYAAEYVVADRVRAHRREACKSWVGTGGAPIPLRDSKGRRALGWTLAPDGSKNFGVFVPDESDRGPDDPKLKKAMDESVAEAEAARDAAKAARKGKAA